MQSYVYVGCGVQTVSTRHVGHSLAYCTCLGWLWGWRISWNEDWQGKPKYSEKTCPNATLSTTNPIWPDRSSNPGRHGGKPATNRLSHGMAWIRSNRLLQSLSGYVRNNVCTALCLICCCTSFSVQARFNAGYKECYGGFLSLLALCLCILHFLGSLWDHRIVCVFLCVRLLWGPCRIKEITLPY
jgi:hypothetical protein